MFAYILRRLALMVPTILGIMLITFAIVQFAPGGPVERCWRRSRARATQPVAHHRRGGDLGGAARANSVGLRPMPAIAARRGSTRLHQEARTAIRLRQAGPRAVPEDDLGLCPFDFGKSYFRDVSVLQLIRERLPVSISLGLWMTLISYAISIPLGIRKAVHDGSRFDLWTSGVVIIGYAIPSFLFGIALIILFAGARSSSSFPCAASPPRTSRP